MESKSLVIGNTSFEKIEKQIAIGEKLLRIVLRKKDEEKLKNKLIEVISELYDIIAIICSRFPLSAEVIDTFKDKLDWEALCGNQNINIDEKFIDKYFSYVNWMSLSENTSIKWEKTTLDKYSNYLDFNKIFFWDENPIFKNNKSLINSYLDKINPEEISEFNDFEFPFEFFKENVDVFLKEHYEFEYSKQNLELVKNKVDWNQISFSEKLYLNNDLLITFNKYWKWDELIIIEHKDKKNSYFRVFYTYYSDGKYSNLKYDDKIIFDEELLDSLVKYDLVWPHLSRDIDFKNKNSLLVKYKDKWNWDFISSNLTISWSNDLIENLKYNINWSFFSLNPNLEWTYEFIEQYKEFWDWKTLGSNMFLPWTFEFYEKYKKNFQMDYLFFVEEQVFKNDDFYRSNWGLSDFYVNNLYCKDIKRNNFEIKLIEHLKDVLDWRLFSKRYEWYPEDLTKFKDYIVWDELSSNKNSTWSIEVLKKFKNKWNWEKIGIFKLIDDFDYELLQDYVKYLKEINDYSRSRSTIIILNFFLKIIDENDVVKILESHNNLSLNK